MRGDPVDLRALCVVCGADMWPCRSDKMYCSQRCVNKDLYRLEREAKIEARAGRCCAECGGRIPVELREGTIYCTRACGHRAARRRKKSRRDAKVGPRTCAECGAEIPLSMKATARYCSSRCRRNDWQRRARAVRRAGELLKQVEPAHGANQNISDAGDTKVLTRKQAAADAGMSKHQQRTTYITSFAMEFGQALLLVGLFGQRFAR